eukprot:TRINITY_DN582_c0_g1_i1.p1 TRINITY_DN582_c0_g1~~TRINITY_DN582_c0_g1_i1.p1  ORF type:complete len:510 (+),score=97.37 TRINITY_DN582_c0_g1_i1:90-1619(+)
MSHSTMTPFIPSTLSCSIMDGVDKPQVVSIVVLGASGDLAKKKTFPALYALFCRELLSPNTIVYGYSRSHLTREQFHEQVTKYFKGDNATKEKFFSMCHYFAGGYDSAKDFERLNQELSELEKKSCSESSNRIFYLAIPPSVFVDAARAIKESGCSKNGWNRIIVEKPFGHDYDSAVQLSKELSPLFPEQDLYRIDHYLGKEMVQNLMVLRFANAFLEPIWSRHHIANVMISFKEDIGTEGRGGYFDQTGIVRDVMQNHLIQIMALVAMEPPVTLQAEDVRDEKVKLLRAVPPIEVRDIVIGQYDRSEDGKKKSYIEDDEKIPKDSITPTFATAIAFVRNDRWSDVPFILKCGKALNERKAEIRIQFRKPLHHLFNDNELTPNELVIRVQPNEAVYMKMLQKKPGLTSEMVQSELDLTYKSRFNEALNLPDAYERLILDVIRGDHNLFVRNDELEAAWKIFTKPLQTLEKERIKPILYPFGSRGPRQSDELLQRYGFVRSENYVWPGKL